MERSAKGGFTMKARQSKLLIIGAVLGLFFAFLPPRAFADTVGITLSSPLAGSPGDTITVTGDLTNNDSANAYYFIADEFPSLDPALINPTDLIILNATFGPGPASIAAGGTLSGVDLFTFQIASSALPGSYSGVFQLYGDTDGSNCSPGDGDCVLLSTLDYSVNVSRVTPTPEPGTFSLVMLGLLAGLGLLAYRVR
jgi:hypothetical protein